MWLVVKLIGRIVLLVVLVGAAINAAMSLSRWEWARATFATLVFLAALILMVTATLLARITTLERRLAERPSTSESVSADLRPTDRFAWLQPDDRTFVFLPVLLGLGLVVSVIATVSERVVAWILGSSHSSEHSETRQFLGLLRSPIALALNVIIVAVVATSGIIFLGRLTKTPANEAILAGERVYVVEWESRYGAETDPVGDLTRLAGYCTFRVPGGMSVDSIEAVSSDTAVMVTSPLLGLHNERAFRGCLNDTILDRRQARVTSVSPDPALDEGPLAVPQA